MNKRIIASFLITLIVISAPVLADTYAYVKAFLNVPSDTSFTIAFPSAYTARTASGTDEAGATVIPEYITFNFTTPPDNFRQPYTNGSASNNQVGLSKPIMLIDATGNTNISLYIRTNTTVPGTLAMGFNGSQNVTGCTNTQTTVLTPVTTTYQAIFTRLSFNGVGCLFNLTLYGNASVGAPAGDTLIELLLKANQST